MHRSYNTLANDVQCSHSEHLEPIQLRGREAGDHIVRTWTSAFTRTATSGRCARPASPASAAAASAASRCSSCWRAACAMREKR